MNRTQMWFFLNKFPIVMFSSRLFTNLFDNQPRWQVHTSYVNNWCLISDEIPSALLEQLIQGILVCLRSVAREVIKSCLGFFKVTVFLKGLRHIFSNSLRKSIEHFSSMKKKKRKKNKGKIFIKTAVLMLTTVFIRVFTFGWARRD